MPRKTRAATAKAVGASHKISRIDQKLISGTS
jgi:hypothetical protein